MVGDLSHYPHEIPLNHIKPPIVDGGRPVKYIKISQAILPWLARAFLTGRLLDVALGFVGKGGDAVNALAPIAGNVDGLGPGVFPLVWSCGLLLEV